MFITKGPVDPEDFIGRQELVEAEEYLKKGDYIVLLGARQTGKTSLLNKLQDSLKKDYHFIYLDCQRLYNQDPTESYEYICSHVEETLGIVVSNGQMRPVKSGVGFFEFLKSVLEQKGDRPIVIMLDEMGALTQESINSLANSIRSIFHQRNDDLTLGRLLFVLSGATDILELATSKTSPLKNVVFTIYMGDLNRDETRQLLNQGFGPEIRVSPRVVDRIYEETHGHPYLVQRVGDILENTLKKGASSQITVELVKTAVPELLRDDVNLEHTNSLLAREDEKVLETLEDIHIGSYKGRFTRIDPILARLELIGVIREDDQGKCVIRNRIYERMLETQPGVEPAVEVNGHFYQERWLRIVTALMTLSAGILAVFATISGSGQAFTIALILAFIALLAFVFYLLTISS